MSERKYTVISVLSVAVAVVLWAAATESGIISRAKIPSPTDLVTEFVHLLEVGYSGSPMWKHVGASLGRTLAGLICAIVIGTPIGLLIGYSRAASAVLEPFFSVLRPMPAIAFIPLVILYFGIGEFSKIVLIFFTSMLHMILHAASGVRAVPNELLRVAYNFGLRKKDLFLHVILPAALPHVMTGIRTTTAIGWALVVAAELVGAQAGLGYIVMDAATFFRISDIYIGIILIGLIGFAIEIAEKRLENRLLHWRGR